METRVKAIRELILSSAAKLESSETHYKENIGHIKEDVSDFLKETKEASNHPDEKRIHYFMNPSHPSHQTFERLSSAPNFSGKGKCAAENVSSPIEAWSLLFSDDLLNIILNHTNREIKYKCTKSFYYNDMLDMLELKAFIGLLYYAGWSKKNNDSLDTCFSAHGLPLFRATMFKNRFQFLYSCLLSDDDKKIHGNLTSDFTNIKKIWDLFVTNCIRYYELGYNVTIDEQILEFNGKCTSDRSSLSSKHGKHGKKIVTMNDSETLYMKNAILFISNVELESVNPLPFHYVTTISEPIHNTCRNITCDNWFTSVPLVVNMREKLSLTMVGSLGKSEFIPIESLVKETCQFAYHDNKTLVSSLHSDEINKEQNKSEIVEHYNKTKGAANTFYRLCHEYTVNREAHSWSLRIFYAMLDQAAVNSFVLYTLNADNQVITRDKFLLDLSMALIKPFLINRLSCPKLNISQKYIIKSFLDEQDLPEEDHSNLNVSNKLPKNAKCRICTFLKREATDYKCLKCNQPTCMQHMANICLICAEN